MPTFTSGRPTRALSAVAHHAIVAGQRQLEGAAEAQAIDGRRPRLAAGLELAEQQRQPARALEEGLHGGLLVALLGQPRVVAAERLEHVEVGAARKRLLAGGDDAALDALRRPRPCR